MSNTEPQNKLEDKTSRARKNRGGNVCACLSTTVGRMRASGLTTIGWA